MSTKHMNVFMASPHIEHVCSTGKSQTNAARGSLGIRIDIDIKNDLVQALCLADIIKEACPHPPMARILLLQMRSAAQGCHLVQAAAALAGIALADAQSIITLRACAKNNQPSLIASLSADSAALYRQASR